jgi:hypothetical protein
LIGAAVSIAPKASAVSAYTAAVIDVVDAGRTSVAVAIAGVLESCVKTLPLVFRPSLVITLLKLQQKLFLFPPRITAAEARLVSRRSVSGSPLRLNFAIG